MSDTNNVKVTKNGFGITALVLGIIALVFSWVPLINNFAAILAGLGAIFGLIGLIKIVKVQGKKTFSIVALVINIAAFALVLSSQAALSNAIDSVNEGPKAEAGAQTTDLAPGQSVTLENGLVVSVDKVQKGLTFDFMDGKYMAVAVTVQNNGKKNASFNPFDWKSVNADGVQKGFEIVPNAENQLESGEIQPGGKVSGNIYFKDDTVKVEYVTGLSQSAAASWNVK